MRKLGKDRGHGWLIGWAVVFLTASVTLTAGLVMANPFFNNPIWLIAGLIAYGIFGIATSVTMMTPEYEPLPPLPRKQDRA